MVINPEINGREHTQSNDVSAKGRDMTFHLSILTRFSLKLLVIGGCMSLIGLPAFAQAVDKVDLSGVKLTIGIQAASSSASVALVEASDVFHDTPYELEWAHFSGANAAVEALQAGALDVNIGLNFSAPVLNQANANVPWTLEDRPYVIVGANHQTSRGGIGLVVAAESDIRTINDLAGGSVSFARGTVNHYFFALAAKQAGLDLDAVKLVLMPLAEARAAFTGGAVDSLVTSVLNARPLVRSGDGRMIATSEGLFDTYHWIVARSEVLKDAEKEAAVADILTRLQQLNVWQAENPDKVAEIYETVARQHPDDARLTAQESFTQLVPIDEAVIAANQSQADVFFDAGVAATLINASIGFDPRFNAVVAANPVPVHLQLAQ